MANSSRDQILAALRSAVVEETPLPPIGGTPSEFTDCRQKFADVLQAVGGRAVFVRDRAELNAQLEQLPTYRDAKHVCSLVEGIRKANLDLAAVEDPHDLECVDFFLAPGEFAVAENAAVWITDSATKHRVLYSITQHLALVVRADSLLSNMHQAYARLKFDQPRFGLFLSGPSKTADIEQSLVIGAQGARSLIVFLIEDLS